MRIASLHVDWIALSRPTAISILLSHFATYLIAGVIHRDLKASNILIDGAGNVAITDHGLSVYAHRCSQSAPDYARVCWGQHPETTDACCLGCLQVNKLKDMQKAADKLEVTGMNPTQAGFAAAESMKTAAMALNNVRPKPVSRTYSGGGGGGGNDQVSGAMMMAGAGAMPLTGTSADSTSAGGTASSASVTAAGNGGQKSGSSIFSFRSLLGGKSRDSRTGPDGSSVNVGQPATRGSMFKTSAHAPVSTDGMSRVSRGDPQELQKHMCAEVGCTGGNSCMTAGDSRSSRTSRTSRIDSHGAEDTISSPDPASAKTELEEMMRKCMVNPVVLVASDCSCPVRHDDGRGWYKGRAGTSAYWCPQMIARDGAGDRMAYGMEAGWTLEPGQPLRTRPSIATLTHLLIPCYLLTNPR